MDKARGFLGQEGCGGHRDDPGEEHEEEEHRRLDEKERRRFFLLMGILVAVAVAELLGLSAVFAVLAVLSNPDSVTSGGRLNWLYDTLGFTSVHDFQIAVAAGAIVFLLASQAVKAVGIYSTARYTSMRSYTLSSRLLGVGLASGMAIAYPVGLGLAAGAMIFVVSHEVIPETHRNGHQTPATVGLMAGFAVMMVLDAMLG